LFRLDRIGRHRDATLDESPRSRFRADMSALRLSVAARADERGALYLVVHEVHELAADPVKLAHVPGQH
jgi:hypothetical protein